MDETEKENMELLSVEEAAAYLKFSTTFVYRLAREKKDSACKLWQTHYFSQNGFI